MVCSDADEACPFVPVQQRDFHCLTRPKKFENTDLEEIKYDAATMPYCNRDIFYVFKNQN